MSTTNGSAVVNASEVFPAALEAFAQSIASMRSYVQAIETHLAHERSRLIAENGSAHIPLVLVEVNIALEHGRVPESERAKLESALERIERLLAPTVTIDRKSQEVRVQTSDPRIRSAIEHAMKRMSEHDEKIKTFREGVVVMSVGIVEVLMSKLLRLHYESNEDRLVESGYTFTYDQLRRFTDLRDAREFLISKRVTDSMYGGMVSWIDDCKKFFGIGAGYMDRSREKLQELALRRNLIVHSDARASQAYVDALRSTGGPNVGDKIATSRKYLESAISMLESGFVLLACEVWSRTSQNSADQQIADFLVQQSYEALLDERWPTAISFAQFAESGKSISETTRLMARVNRWQGFKWSGRFSEVQSELAATDFSALNMGFQLAGAALRGDDTTFFDLFERALSAGELTPWAATEWPIFKEMRRDPKFDQLLKESGARYEPAVPVDDKELMTLFLADARAQASALPLGEMPATKTVSGAESSNKPRRRKISNAGEPIANAEKPTVKKVKRSARK